MTWLISQQDLHLKKIQKFFSQFKKNSLKQKAK